LVGSSAAYAEVARTRDARMSDLRFMIEFLSLYLLRYIRRHLFSYPILKKLVNPAAKDWGFGAGNDIMAHKELI
jgi:hypothetical protein